ncbi:hypothetical protein BDY19DRAFT_926802 [Irpex rosettiformis]|uniref:Uncharacterized protein n=1 Tax=Irpex rosettiformis TaxID=378272 RepID=A0ACB8UEU5_9APHY|nr:hypothetical protein BDY19DRAFT_926802 [Irpex rosettiformis]
MSLPHDGFIEPAQEDDSSSTSQHEPTAHGDTSGNILKPTNEHTLIPEPYCYNMVEHPSAAIERACLNPIHSISHIPQRQNHRNTGTKNEMLLSYLSHGLAYTIGSALSCLPPPSLEICLQAFLIPNKAGLTAGARAWSKHAHRSGNTTTDDTLASTSDAMAKSLRWWGTPSGPVARINERAVELFWRVWRGATWRNLHWLPHQVLVYEVRVPEGYGMRWAQHRSEPDVNDEKDHGSGVESGLDGSPSEGGGADADTVEATSSDVPWMFRGFVEPMMENGHELGWRH